MIHLGNGDMENVAIDTQSINSNSSCHSFFGTCYWSNKFTYQMV